MVNKLLFKQMDVFTSKPFKGNPVAVVNCMDISEDEISSETMLSIANWTNLSETTFLFKPTDPTKSNYKLRIFTPANELPFAGHPTIGSCKAYLQFTDQIQTLKYIRQECEVGIIDLVSDVDTGIISLKAEKTDLDKLEADVVKLYQESLTNNGKPIKPIDSPYVLHVGPEWVVFLVEDSETCYNANPDFGKMAEISLKYGHSGIILAGKKSKFDENSSVLEMEMRAFVPAYNVNEDPVCGSGSIALIRYLQQKYNFSKTTRINISQGGRMTREGHIYAEIKVTSDGISYHCGGDALCVVDGVINV
ncbi:hypothetical protein TPHA_0E02280 [Tetrapisispora phaffii CBS 4417]|uniref:Phenazine biosynthesis protein n=1 Tax=Tetrapisispora phaffii (strain ATCC 24235 / CBS 4417 / NBRC 1672 / NRRL Y-8282 / UCD 70-5) TaxID=1071381 RepID=G8BTU2_TETPH|nr:hypothetical protein TPHA_0E02280 [Tetrapisispora phaffii CBS 4417]CCE63320.1 hypothetical protein TPHA_0E02280 [Tetrapisispora phaffii CBS 4417]